MQGYAALSLSYYDADDDGGRYPEDGHNKEHTGHNVLTHELNYVYVCVCVCVVCVCVCVCVGVCVWVGGWVWINCTVYSYYNIKWGQICTLYTLKLYYYSLHNSYVVLFLT